MLERILKGFFDLERIRRGGCRVLIEDGSTNCGANAKMTREVLEGNGVEVEDLKSLVVVQDPTMAVRTVASFEKVFEDVGVSIMSAPIFVPVMHMVDEGTGNGNGGVMRWDVGQMGVEEGELWEKERFFELIMGEVPRLRDDAGGYGPRGKGFIVHVDIPSEVEDAWGRLSKTSKSSR